MTGSGQERGPGRVSVIQPGARLHYAAPAAFARAGLLKALHTDLHADHWWLRLAGAALPGRATPKPLRRLFGRRLPPGLPARLVRDRPLATLAGRGGRVTAGLLADLERAARPGDVVYTVLINEDNATMARLKARGVRLVHECIIGPDVGLRLIDEFRRYGLAEGMPDRAQVEAGRARDAAKYALADLVLVPSAFTAAAVAALAPAGTPIAMVPYGFDLAPFRRPAAPEPGRVLAVGSVGLRKGHPDLAAAARALGDAVTVRVAGPAEAPLSGLAIMAGPVYLGQVPRAEVVAEFAKADVFALPTICDSFGIVLVEALAMGVPVVTTPNCGDIVRDGVDGFVVPPRDPEALAAAILRIVSDRALRAEMSANARRRAEDFSQAAYARRLLAAVAPLLPPGAAPRAAEG